MAEARQKEMKVNITVVATKTLMAGLEPADVAMLQGNAQTAYQDKPIEDSIGEREWSDSFRFALDAAAIKTEEDRLKRHYIPGVLDIYEVSDPKEIEAVNNDPRIDRRFDSRTCPLNWLFVKRSLSALSYAGKRFPTMSSRDSVERKSAQEALWNRLNLKVAEVKLGPEELEPLAQWVRGYGAQESLGMQAQQVLGRLFSETFVATPESWEAATTLVRAPRASNVAKLIWWRVTGKLTRAKRKLASMVNDDLSAVNAIGIAVHNLVKSLIEMRALYSDASRRRTLSPAEGANECVVAPASVFRQATVAGELDGNPFSNNSLFILNIGVAAKLEGAGALVFMRDSWSSCPAEQWVPAMLEGVWLRAGARD
jgi:hypothetical protein